jgi:hypothetical protein
MSVLKAPAVMLGLFLSMAVSLYGEGPAFRLDGQGGWLWADRNGDIVFYRQSVSAEQADFWRLSFTGEKFSSDHKNLRFQGSAFFVEGGIQGPLGGIYTSLGFYNHGNMELLWGNQRFENRGGDGSSFTLAIPVRLNQSSLVFSYTSLTASWQDGSFYWFFGRPRLDAFHHGGLSFSFGEKRRIDVAGLFIDGGILSPEDRGLLDFSLRGFYASYRRQKDFHPLTLGWNFGVLYGKAWLDGALTASNQHYSLFPYLVYEISGQISAFAGYGMVNFAYRTMFFSLDAQLGALQFFYSGSNADVHYKEKTLFGGRERRYAFTPIDLGDLGCAFIGLDVALLLPDSKTKPHVAVGIKKLFFIPWNYQQIISSPGDSSPGGSGGETQGTGSPAAISQDMLKTALLSGFSLYLSLRY